MKKILLAICIVGSLHLSAQTSIAFQHLGNATFQNNYLNPSIIPDINKWYIGLPVLSGVHGHYNNKTSYNETFTGRNEAGKLLPDIDKILSNTQAQNMLSAQANINLLQVGYRLKSGPLLSLTINERVEGDFLYPEEIIDYVWRDGYRPRINQDVKVTPVGVRAAHFREFGLGAAIPVNEQLTVGVRAKYLVGFFNVSTPGNFTGTIRTDGEAFQTSADWERAALRRSGIDILQAQNGFSSDDIGSHLLFNSNSGVSLDVGATYRLGKYNTFTGAVTDIGFIGWKENIDNDVLIDSNFEYEGIDVQEFEGSITQVLEDSLFNRFESEKNTDAYTDWLPTTARGSWIYHYNSSTDIYATVNTRLVQRQIKMLYGLGVTKKFNNAFTCSVTATKLPQQFLNLGAAFAAMGGPVQLYMAVDQIINFNAPDIKAFDVRMGMSFRFGKITSEQKGNYKNRVINDPRGLDTHNFLGNKVKTKKRQGIYSIINKQKRRELKNTRTRRDNKVRKKSLNGRKGKRKK